MSVDWSAAIGAIVGAVVAVIVVLRWRSHSKSRSVHFQFDWHSKRRDDSTEVKEEDENSG